MGHRFGDVSRFFRVQGSGLSFADRTETAMACADIAAEHESRRAIRPAFEDVRAARFLADGVQIQPFDELQNVVLVRRITETDAKPFGLGLTDFLVVTDNTEFAGQLIYL
jgi:hypothetical protein